jgi:flagellar protein FlgJ
MTMPPSAFIALLLPAAQATHRATGIPASLILAQAALETGWGAKAPGCNLFGIKPGPKWAGPVTVITTHEFIKGVRTQVQDKFRAYKDWAECMADHANFLKVNPRYAACFKEKTGEGWARAIAKAGYATDPKYADLLISIMRGRNMSQYDNLKGKT